MRSVRAWQTLLLTGTLAVTPAFASHAHRSPTSGHSHLSSRRKSPSHQVKGQRQIDPARAREIQSALIREKYLTGEPTGEWDQASQQAMQRYQADNNWQSKIIPDSRALIKLGLGPNEVAGTSSGLETAAAPAAAPAPKAAAQAKHPEPGSNGASSALTLADAHSILN
jgi:hypothetical protein